MIIVFRKSNGAVLAANEYRQGATIIEPPVLDFFPLFDSGVHGTLSVDSSLFPADFMLISYVNYQVDDLVTPTTVILKNYIEVVVSNLLMQADGSTVQTVTINIKDHSGTLITTGSYAIDLTADRGFLSAPQVTTVSGTATANFYASKEVGSSVIRAVDDDAEPITKVTGLIAGVSSQIVFAATSIVSSPLSPLANVASIPNGSLAQHFLINFYDGKAIPAGVEIAVDSGGVIGTNPLAMTTAYTTDGSMSGTAKFNTPFNCMRRRIEGKATFIFAPSQTETLFWMGLTDGDISSYGPSSGGLNGHVVAAVGVDTSSGDTFYRAVKGDGVSIGTSIFGAGFTPGGATLYQLDIEWHNDDGENNVTFTLTKLAGGTGSSTVVMFGAEMPPQDSPMGIFGSVRATEAAVKTFEMKTVYVQHS